MSCGIGPVERRLHIAQQPCLDWRVADHIQQLFVTPHVILQRRDIEITQDHHRIIFVFPLGEEFFHAAQKVQLMGEFFILVRVGNIAAGGDIKIVQLHAILKCHADMAGMAFAAEIQAAAFPEGQAREDRHPVIGLLAVDGVMHITQIVEGGGGEEFVDHLGLLQRQNIRLLVPQEAAHQGDAMAHRIDVPAGDFHFTHASYAATAQHP